jgi:hypothetical protein
MPLAVGLEDMTGQTRAPAEVVEHPAWVLEEVAALAGAEEASAAVVVDAADRAAV